MHDVFISYNSQNRLDAGLVRKVLHTNSIRCWMAPEDIPAGKDYAASVPAAIEECRVFVLLLSNAAQKSIWIPRELDLAVNGGKIIIPFVLEELELLDEFNFYLIGSQRLNAYHQRADALQVLVDRIRALLDLEPVRTAHAAATTRVPKRLKKHDPELNRRIGERAGEYISTDLVRSLRQFRTSDHELLRRHLNIPASDKIFLACSCSLTRSGKEGFAISTSGLYYRPAMEPTSFRLSWNSFIEIDQFFYTGFPGYKLMGSSPDGTITIAEGVRLLSYDRRYLLRFLELLCNILQEEFV